MAKIVLGIAASHTPLLTLSAEQWQHRAAADFANTALNMSDGRLLSYGQVLAELGPRAADVIDAATLAAKERACQAALDRLAADLAAAAPDVVLIVGDDQRELFGAGNQPAIAIFHGEQIVMSNKFADPGNPEWLQTLGRGYLMDDRHVLPAAPELALELIRGLVDAQFDIAACAQVDGSGGSGSGGTGSAHTGFGHAYGFIVQRLFGGRKIPVLPVLLNTYYAPNVPSAARCHDLGQALARVIAASPSQARVAVVASGGLSHFVVDEAMDRSVLAALASGEHSTLRSLPRGALNSGSSEILNWVTVAGAVQHLPLRWHDYQPLYRTPAGTGVGAGFAAWGPN